MQKDYKVRGPIYKVIREDGEYALKAAVDLTVPDNPTDLIAIHWKTIGTFATCEAANAVYKCLNDREKSQAGWFWADELLRESALHDEIENVLDDSEYDPETGEYRYFTDTGRCIAVTPMGEVVEKKTESDEFRTDRFTWKKGDLKLVEEGGDDDE